MDPWNEGKAEAKKSSVSNVLIGLTLGFVAHWPAIQECFKHCNSWTLKVEKVLTFVAFSAGFSKPGLLVFKIFKNLLNDVTIKLSGVPLQISPLIDNIAQVGT